MNRRALVGFFLTIIILPAMGRAQEIDDAEIRTAIRRGVQYLKGHQNADGSWNYGAHPVGMTSLAGLALAEDGVTLDEPSLRKAYQFVQTNASTTNQTYDISLAILFLSRLGKPGDGDLIRDLGARLAAGQLSSGGWTYVCPLKVPVARPASVTNAPGGASKKSDPPRRAGRIVAGGGLNQGFGDNSNTQFAVLGMWAAGRAGMDVKETMIDVDRRFRATQSTQGGWGYNAPGTDREAMTCAGLMALILAKGHKVLEGHMTNRRPDDDKADGKGTPKKMDSDPQIEKGISRVEQYCTAINQGSGLYFLWSVERVGVAMGLSRIGRVDWYGKGATVLLKTQFEDGCWRTSHGELADTSFALLFLRRSNLTQGMPQLVTNRGEGANDSKMRSGGLEDLIKTVRPPATPLKEKEKAPAPDDGSP